jgi:hypothetical protein
MRKLNYVHQTKIWLHMILPDDVLQIIKEYSKPITNPIGDIFT